MSISNDDEDEFQSADEDGFDDDLHDDIKVIDSVEDSKSELRPKEQTDRKTECIAEEPEIEHSSADKLELSPSVSDVDKSESKHTSNCEDEEEEDDNEEALAERIRERNLKIARKFSAELAKSVKASAPIPVKTEPPIGFRVDDIEYPDIPNSDKNIRHPQAPPPTPALSSSFSAEEPSSPTQDSPASQYGWRVPIKPREKPTDTPPQEQSNLNQARVALDRLSEKYSDTDKSLFQKVADDLKRVSIKSEDRPIATDSQDPPSQGPSGLPSLSSLGQSFGGWNWNSASRILASASEVTSQVSSVLDSVVNAQRSASTQQTTSSSPGHQNTDQAPSFAGPQPSGSKVSMSASEAVSNDALVDLTLNAMESLGKKAFGAMTHRDESGSLQIKGLGRPWEQLLNITKPQVERPEDDRIHDKPSSSTSIPAEPTKVKDSDNDSDRKSSVRRRVVNYDDSDKLD